MVFKIGGCERQTFCLKQPQRAKYLRRIPDVPTTQQKREPQSTLNCITTPSSECGQAARQTSSHTQSCTKMTKCEGCRGKKCGKRRVCDERYRDVTLAVTSSREHVPEKNNRRAKQSVAALPRTETVKANSPHAESSSERVSG